MKFRRKAAQATEADDAVESDVEETDPGPAGPVDFDDLDDDGETDRVDLGSLLIEPTPGRELRLQVDEASGAVQSVVLAGQDGAIELRAFAAPRNGDLWDEVRPQIVEDLAQRGGKATEREGRFGIELLCQAPAQLPDGGTGTQVSRIIGVNGARWLLRATLLGRPAAEPEGAEEWEDTLGSVVVRRGTEAMPVGEALPLSLPDNARRVDAG